MLHTRYGFPIHAGTAIGEGGAIFIVEGHGDGALVNDWTHMLAPRSRRLQGRWRTLTDGCGAGGHGAHAA